MRIQRTEDLIANLCGNQTSACMHENASQSVHVDAWTHACALKFRRPNKNERISDRWWCQERERESNHKKWPQIPNQVSLFLFFWSHSWPAFGGLLPCIQREASHVAANKITCCPTPAHHSATQQRGCICRLGGKIQRGRDHLIFTKIRCSLNFVLSHIYTYIQRGHTVQHQYYLYVLCALLVLPITCSVYLKPLSFWWQSYVSFKLFYSIVVFDVDSQPPLDITVVLQQQQLNLTEVAERTTYWPLFL